VIWAADVGWQLQSLAVLVLIVLFCEVFMTVEKEMLLKI